MRPGIRNRGIGRVQRGLDALADRSARLGESASGVVDDVSDGWLRSLARQGPGWPALKPSTVRQRIAEGYAPGPPLVKTGALKRGLGQPIVDAERDGATFAIGVDHAVYPLSKRPVKLDRPAVRAVTRTMSRSLHSAYRRG